MTYFFLESNKISGLIFFSIILSITILLLSYLLSVSAPDIKKLSSYECGFDPYTDAKKIFNKKSFFHSINFSHIFVGLLDFELTTFLIIGFISVLVIIAVKKAVSFFHLNKTLVLGQFKKFQKFLKENQHIIFAVFNIFLFVGSLTVFSFWDVFFVFNFWGDLYILFYVAISLNFPIIELFCGLVFLLRLYFNLISWLLIFGALFFLYLYYVLDAFNVFLKMRIFFSDIFSDRKTFIFHQREEFLPFYILEKQSIVLLFFFLVVPRIFKDEFLFFFETNKEVANYFDIILFLSYGSIFMNVLISFIIIFVCNPKMGAKAQIINVCSTCIIAIGTGVLATDVVVDRSIGGVKEPGDGIVVRGVQRYYFNCEARTSADVRAVKDYISISNGRPVPLLPHTRIANTSAIHTYFINNLTPEQKIRLEYNQTGKFPFPATKPDIGGGVKKK